MTTRSELKIYSEPLPASFEDVDDVELEVFFATGIVNPRGPTFTYVAAVGSLRLGVVRQVVEVMLNPFSQQIKQIGSLAIGEDFTHELIAPIFKLTWGDCPTLVLVSSNGSEELRLSRAKAVYSTFDEVAVVNALAMIESFWGDPIARVSAVMDGQRVAKSSARDLAALARMAQLSFNGEHVWPEIRALLYAWDGAINLSGIPDAMRLSAFPWDKFKMHAAEKVFPSLWIPDEPVRDSLPPKASKPERYLPKSIVEVRSDFTRHDWSDFSLEMLADLLKSAIIVYGAEVEAADVPHISRLYRTALALGVDVDTRQVILGGIINLMLDRKLSYMACMPFLVHDPEQRIASDALIEFVSESNYRDGELSAIGELRTLFNENRLANKAAVYGALAVLGDIEVLPLLNEIWPTLSVNEVVAASKVQGNFLKHHTIQFWLSRCKDLVGKKGEIPERMFGGCVSALSTCLSYANERVVIAAKRNFPCVYQAEPLTRLRSWTLDEYAELIAPDLYAMEALEHAPKLFSSVLRDWGLKPASELVDQYLPESNVGGGAFTKLRDLAPKQVSNFEHLWAMAEGGDVESQFFVAAHHYWNSSDPDHMAKAREAFLRAASSGHAKAALNLGYMCEFGEGGPASEGEAVRWYELAAGHVVVSAMKNLASLHDRMGNISDSFLWQMKAATFGDVESQCNVGYAYSNGRGVAESPERAAVFYRLAAANGNVIAQLNLSNYFYIGRGVGKDVQQATRWARLAAEQGYAPAQKRLADFYATGDGVEKSDRLAFEWNMKAAIQANSYAQNALGFHYATGTGVESSSLFAYMWLASAASLGSEEAKGNLSKVFVDESSDQVKLIQAAVEGDADMQAQLAYKLKSGDGFPTNDGASIFWLTKAATNGHPWAQTNLAKIIADGVDDPCKQGALYWLSLAANNGFPDALRQLGVWQLTAREGCDFDLTLGAKNLLQASLLGSNEAREQFETLRERFKDIDWQRVFESIRWPQLAVMAGPLAPGHFDRIRQAQEQDDSSEEAEWLAFDRELAEATFSNGTDGFCGILSLLFDKKLRVDSLTVKRVYVNEKACSAVFLNFFDLKLEDGFPMYWRPSHEKVDMTLKLLALMEGRQWMRWELQDG